MRGIIAYNVLMSALQYMESVQQCDAAMLQVLQHQTEETKQAQEEVAGRLALLEQRFGTSGGERAAHQVCNRSPAVHCLVIFLPDSAICRPLLSSVNLSVSVLLFKLTTRMRAHMHSRP